jgi:muramoyltetrapeptide carboxypeptidase
VLRGIGWLGQRYRVSFDRGLFSRTGFLAGDDGRRLGELTRALVDPTVDAIVTARGGHGLLRIIAEVPWNRYAEHPKWLVGFSDPTAIHAEIWRVGGVSLHAANVAGLGRADAEARHAWVRALEHPDEPKVLQGKPWISGSVVGPLVGGNLTVLTMLAAAGRLHLPEGCILALEDVTESSYRIDRMLSALLVGGYFERVAGVALGEFTDCSAGVFRVTVEQVLEERLGTTRPLVRDLPFGHGRRNLPLTFGRVAKLDGTLGTLTF